MYKQIGNVKNVIRNLILVTVQGYIPHTQAEICTTKETSGVIPPKTMTCTTLRLIPPPTPRMTSWGSTRWCMQWLPPLAEYLTWWRRRWLWWTSVGCWCWMRLTSCSPRISRACWTESSPIYLQSDRSSCTLPLSPLLWSSLWKSTWGEFATVLSLSHLCFKFL